MLRIFLSNSWEANWHTKKILEMKQDIWFIFLIHFYIHISNIYKLKISDSSTLATK